MFSVKLGWQWRNRFYQTNSFWLPDIRQNCQLVKLDLAWCIWEDCKCPYGQSYVKPSDNTSLCGSTVAGVHLSLHRKILDWNLKWLWGALRSFDVLKFTMRRKRTEFKSSEHFLNTTSGAEKLCQHWSPKSCSYSSGHLRMTPKACYNAQLYS